MRARKKSYLTVTDLFCGAGGSSLGAVAAGADLRLALNHWRLAIETHNTNFPEADHDCADVSTADPRRYPATDILIASPSCTNHSLAKGRKVPQAQFGLFEGKRQVDPAAERSRATMWDVPRFAEIHRYNMIIVENVPDARKWVLWDAWWQAMLLLGYDGEVVYFNSQFAHPTPQSRDRMYMVFWKKGNRKPDLEIQPLAYCPACGVDVKSVQSWKNPHKQWGRWGRYGVQYVYRCPACAGEVRPYYYAAMNAIDWNDLGERIGDRSRPLKKRTMERIRIGLDKFGGQTLVMQTSYGDHNGRVRSAMVEPLATQTTRQDQAVVSPFLVAVGGAQAHRIDRHFAVDDPIPTITTSPRMALINPPYFVRLRNHSDAHGADEPMGTVTAGGQHHGVSFPPGFLLQYYGTENMSSLGEPVPTVTTVDRHALVHMPFLLGYANGSGPPRPVTDPAFTVHTANGQGVALPGQELKVEDCRFRMLKPPEIGRAMSFPDEYVVLGTNREQVRQYGNAVCPPTMSVLMDRCIASLA